MFHVDRSTLAKPEFSLASCLQALTANPNIYPPPNLTQHTHIQDIWSREKLFLNILIFWTELLGPTHKQSRREGERGLICDIIDRPPALPRCMSAYLAIGWGWGSACDVSHLQHNGSRQAAAAPKMMLCLHSAIWKIFFGAKHGNKAFLEVQEDLGPVIGRGPDYVNHQPGRICGGSSVCKARPSPATQERIELAMSRGPPMAGQAQQVARNNPLLH